METRDQPSTFISLNDFIRVENIDILHDVAIDRLYKFDKKIKLDFSLINKEISSKINSKFWVLLEDNLTNNPATYDDVILFFDFIYKSLKNMISDDPIMLMYFQSEDYCNINLNPNVNHCQKSCPNLSAKDRAIFINIVEYSNFIISILKHIASPSRAEELNKVSGLILKLLETLVSLEEDNLKSKQELVSDLCNILCHIFAASNNVLYDFANYSLLQIRPFVKSFVDQHERTTFLALNSTFETDFMDTETYAWIKANIGNEKCSANGDKMPVKNYNAVMIDFYIDLLTRKCDGKYPETVKYMDEKAFKTSALRYSLLKELIQFLLKIGKTPIAFSADEESQQLTMSQSLDIILGAIDQKIAIVDETNPENLNKSESVVENLVNICKSKGLLTFAKLFQTARPQENQSDPDDHYDSTMITRLRELLQDTSNDKIPVLALSNEEFALKILSNGSIEGLTMENEQFSDIISTLLQSFAESYCELMVHNKSVYHPFYYEMYKKAVESLSDS